MIRPRLNPDFPIIEAQNTLMSFNFKAQSAFQYLYIFLLIWMEVRGGFLNGKIDNLWRMELKGRFGAEGTLLMSD